MDKLELGGATALVGAAVFSVHSQYANHAGSLADCRNASPSDASARQRILDADVLTGGLVLLVGGTLVATTGRWEPLVLALAGFLLISVYYHAALVGPTVTVPPVYPIAEGEVS